MPYVDVLWKPDRYSAALLVDLCERLQIGVAAALVRYDPDHRVTPAMVDVKVTEVGPYDRIAPDLYVTVLARSEPARDANKVAIADDITNVAAGARVPTDTLVELVLTNRVSHYDYGDG